MFSNESSGYATVSFGMMAIRHGLDVSSVVSAAGCTACGRNGVEECRAFVAPDDEVRGKKERRTPAGRRAGQRWRKSDFASELMKPRETSGWEP
jgi:hypothetical protein